MPELDPVTTSAVVIVSIAALRLAEFAINKVVQSVSKNGNGHKNGNGKTQTDIDIALLQQQQKNLESNHLQHQEDIEKWMEKHDNEHEEDRKLLYKIAIKLGIED